MQKLKLFVVLISINHIKYLNISLHHYSPDDPNDVDFNTKFEIEYEETMKSTLNIKEEYVRPARQKLLNVIKHRRNMLSSQIQKNTQTNFGNNMGIDDEITFVGVHNRRSDHVEFMRERLKIEPLEENYFSFAFEYFRYAFLCM